METRCALSIDCGESLERSNEMVNLSEAKTEMGDLEMRTSVHVLLTVTRLVNKQTKSRTFNQGYFAPLEPETDRPLPLPYRTPLEPSLELIPEGVLVPRPRPLEVDTASRQSRP
jgi:hypothetical protein